MHNIHAYKCIQYEYLNPPVSGAQGKPEKTLGFVKMKKYRNIDPSRPWTTACQRTAQRDR